MNKERIKEEIKHGGSGLNIVHGQLKNMMLEAEDENFAIGTRKEWKRALGYLGILSRRAWLEGYREALTNVYRLTYEIAFLEQDIEKERKGNGNTL